MDWRNRVGLYGSYFLGMAAIGFTLPYLPLYLGEKGLSDRAIGIVSTLAALSALAQFPIGIWSDRIGSRKPFLIAALAVVAASTVLLRDAHGLFWLGFLVILFAENGISRAVIESLSGAEAATLAPPGGVGRRSGALRFWKPIGIVLVALLGSWISEQYGVGAILVPLAVAQGLAVAAALLIHETPRRHESKESASGGAEQSRNAGTHAANGKSGWLPRDAGLWSFVVAMILFHAANAPGGVYLGLFLKRDLHAPDRMLAYAFAVSMVAWMLVVWPGGRLADRLGRKPLLVAAWAIMALRLALVGIVRSPELAVAESGARRFRQWIVRRDRRRVGHRPVSRSETIGRGPGDRRARAWFSAPPSGRPRPVFWLVLSDIADSSSHWPQSVRWPHLSCCSLCLKPSTRTWKLPDGRADQPMAVTSDLSTVP